MSEPYQPIDCALHSELEVAAEHRHPVALRLKSGDILDGVIEDVWTKDGAEYLRLREQDRTRTLRLDELDTFWSALKRREETAGRSWQPGA